MFNLSLVFSWILLVALSVTVIASYFNTVIDEAGGCFPFLWSIICCCLPPIRVNRRRSYPQPSAYGSGAPPTAVYVAHQPPQNVYHDKAHDLPSVPQSNPYAPGPSYGQPQPTYYTPAPVAQPAYGYAPSASGYAGKNI